MRILLMTCLILAACNTPHPGFRGLPVTRVTVEGSTFDVRVSGAQAEAIRINPEYAPRFGPIRERVRRAMAQASGCEVVRVSGDQAQAFGALKCNGVAPPAPRPKPDALECVPVRGSTIKGVGEVTVDVTCYPA